MSQFRFTSRSLADTDQLGQHIAAVAQPGDVVALVGTLGAGKTRLVQSIATALGNPAEAITSPTFVLVNEYTAGRLPVYHFDVYRLKDDDEFLELGAEEYFDREGVTLIEWGDRVEHLLPERASIVAIELADADERQVVVTGAMGDRL
ncbi:tRNA (adenosine(37)-N6)-threonylcarbamoyltransferase complex ATPase subunit type 1 TsaE [Aeoliella sp. ICT_H6.2]|uniref:tRNA threonylcarbamoyladenosine biosynthesis protein TsaE n=1 Tax=Aeoliella straminimaris TaxID=2954799 RepID=A0A9X2FII9_9BACT|nr:tRNA (adenosine(37)-N6)-threonylcarbamoyltransferase complex ATPase subunit type 1 TsaE [Aeoliella straminimaris]MCO6047884.1 tRNA (adenosine(37)-N6)-threonylcarbamoyltransferase complex ATPase subunit type 1 TsaE [Aeoliella straminimaris]